MGSVIPGETGRKRDLHVFMVFSVLYYSILLHLPPADSTVSEDATSARSHPQWLDLIRSARSHPEWLDFIRSARSHPEWLDLIRSARSYPEWLDLIRNG